MIKMDSSKISVGHIALISILFAGVLYLCTWSASISSPFLFSSRRLYNHCSSRSQSDMENLKVPVDELGLALEKASTPNKTVIIAVVNKAYVEQGVDAETTMFDLFLESFWLGEDTRPLLDHLLIIAVDQAAYERCLFKRLNCYKLETEGADQFEGEKIYMSPGFIKMMWRRTHLLLEVLKHGYNFIFTDTDVMWLRNPFSRLGIYNESVDLQMSTDWFNGDPQSENNAINTGFYFTRSNNKTISLFETWYGRKDNSSGKKEQDVLFDLMTAGMFRQLGVHPRFLDTVYFSGFCKDSTDIKAVITVHANCCRSINAKVGDLTAVLRDWKRYKAAIAAAAAAPPSNVTVPFGWTGHFGCRRSWRIKL
ncbi:Nucleotide-diphospho-sugar transferase [Salix suchowensis]|nr:Nucleotide-diphospho-sugar transferase [Salix suchowensis]